VNKLKLLLLTALTWAKDLTWWSGIWTGIALGAFGGYLYAYWVRRSTTIGWVMPLPDFSTVFLIVALAIALSTIHVLIHALRAKG
jgi:hypothetical protein